MPCSHSAKSVRGSAGTQCLAKKAGKMYSQVVHAWRVGVLHAIVHATFHRGTEHVSTFDSGMYFVDSEWKLNEDERLWALIEDTCERLDWAFLTMLIQFRYC